MRRWALLLLPLALLPALGAGFADARLLTHESASNGPVLLGAFAFPERPRELHATVTVSPPQYGAEVSWQVKCRKGSRVRKRVGEVTGAYSPLYVPLRRPFRRPDRCVVSVFSLTFASFEDISIYGTKWHR